MDPLTLSIGAMLAGTVMQQQAQAQAQQRQQRAIRESLARQQSFQQQAEQAALSKAQEFTTEDRQERQGQIEQQIADNLMQPVQQEQRAMQAAPAVQGDVSDDYAIGRARAQADNLASAEALARLFGKTTGAGRLRQQEAIGLADTGQFIDRLGNFARGQHAADQVGIQRAGQPDGFLTLGGTLLQGAGMMGAAGAFGGTGAASGASTGAWTPAGGTIGGNAVGSFNGLRPVNSLFRLPV